MEALILICTYGALSTGAAALSFQAGLRRYYTRRWRKYRFWAVITLMHAVLSLIFVAALWEIS